MRHPAGEEIVKEPFHLPLVEVTVDLDRGVTSHDAKDAITKLFHLSAFAVDVHFVEYIEQ